MSFDIIAIVARLTKSRKPLGGREKRACTSPNNTQSLQLPKLLHAAMEQPSVARIVSDATM
jgi:hypothetical protein